jgi:molybdenum cofactor biosynthesis protein B
MSGFRHHSDARRLGPVRCAVLTVSDTRTAATDRSGPLLAALLRCAGHDPAQSAIVPDDPPRIDEWIERRLADPSIQAVLATGGTGLGRRDTTIEVVRRKLTIEIEGFGELFRMLSYRQVGAAAMLSRAVGGLVIRDAGSGGETFLFALPGSPDAVTVAVRFLIGPQLAHMALHRGASGARGG